MSTKLKVLCVFLSIFLAFIVFAQEAEEDLIPDNLKSYEIALKMGNDTAKQFYEAVLAYEKGECLLAELDEKGKIVAQAFSQIQNLEKEYAEYVYYAELEEYFMFYTMSMQKYAMDGDQKYQEITAYSEANYIRTLDFAYEKSNLLTSHWTHYKNGILTKAKVEETAKIAYEFFQIARQGFQNSTTWGLTQEKLPEYQKKLEYAHKQLSTFETEYKNYPH